MSEDDFSYNSQLARRINGDLDERTSKSGAKTRVQGFDNPEERILNFLAHVVVAIIGVIGFMYLYSV